MTMGKKATRNPTNTRSGLTEVMTVLGAYREALVLIGGWAPYLILEQFGRRETSVDSSTSAPSTLISSSIQQSWAPRSTPQSWSCFLIGDTSPRGQFLPVPADDPFTPGRP